MTSLITGPDARARCAWVGDDVEYRRYHDEEWGTPLHGDRALFEKMALEGFQAGLSWITILRKRPRFREVFAGFEPEVVAEFDEDDVERLMTDAGIIRNRAKIEATIGNARLVAGDGRGRARRADVVVRAAGIRHPTREHGRRAGCHRRVDGAEQGAAPPRVPLRRADHDVRAHAVRGHGRRSSGGMLARLTSGSGMNRYFGSLRMNGCAVRLHRPAVGSE